MTVWFSKEGNHISASALGFGRSDVGFVVFMLFAKFGKKTRRTKPARDRHAMLRFSYYGIHFGPITESKLDNKILSGSHQSGGLSTAADGGTCKILQFVVSLFTNQTPSINPFGPKWHCIRNCCRRRRDKKCRIYWMIKSNQRRAIFDCVYLQYNHCHTLVAFGSPAKATF